MDPIDEHTCPGCNASLTEGARFCAFCGMLVASAAPAPTLARGEHRQITVVFCDLVGSTALSGKMEPEDLQALLRSYQQICAREIEARGGMISRYLGDGVLAYFGYPHATEDAAGRAIDAAIGILRDVRREDGRKLYGARIEFAARIALHTGRALVSEMGAGITRDQHAITGLVPNLAARLEQCAPRNGIVVSSETRALTVRKFAFRSLGAQTLKGFDDPIEVFEVLGRRLDTSMIPKRDAPIIGRDAELEVLGRCWGQVLDGGTARAVVLAEPGMGKSSLAATFIGGLQLRSRQTIEIAGFNTSRNTPFVSLQKTIALWLEAGRASGAGPPEAMLAHWFNVPDISASEEAQLILAFARRELELSADMRAALIGACRKLVQSLPKPLLLVVEDAHWADHSTLELLDRITAEASEVMLLLMARPGHRVEELVSGATLVDLAPLDGANCALLARQVAGAPLDNALSRRVFDLSNGVPLFVEEYTKAQIAAGAFEKSRGVFRRADGGAETTIPPSIHDLITARLDRLGRNKQIVQLAAVLGRRFELRALAALAGMEGAELGPELDSLVEGEILTRDWSGAFVFAHALFQKAAYEGLVRATRQELHGRYVDWLEEAGPQLEAMPAEALGFHLEACERLDAAVEQYLAAGLDARAASASHEAVAHFRKCRDLLDRMERGAESFRLRVQELLASALLSARGAGAPETREAYRVAVELAERLPETKWHFAAYWGWWRVSETFSVMAERAQHLVDISGRMKGVTFRLQAQHCAWANEFQIGNLSKVLDHARSGLELYSTEEIEPATSYYGGHDCKVCALGEIALARWLQGAGDSALADLDAAMQHAKALAHAGTLLHALDIGTMLHHYRRDTAACLAFASRLARMAETHDLEEYRAKSEIFAAWVEIENGALRDGLERLDAGFEILCAVGTPEDFPVYNCMRAEALCRLGETDAAFNALGDARAVVAAEGVSYWSAEVDRHEALTAMAATASDSGFIAERLRSAAQTARAQNARALELRIALTALDWAVQSGADTGEAETALAAVLDRLGSDHVSRDAATARERLALAPVAT